MPAQVSAWHFQAFQRSAAGPAQALPVLKRMEWTTHRGLGPGAEILGRDLRQRSVLELGCGPGHNAAHLAARHGAIVTGVDLVGLQVRRARSHYGRLDRVTFVAGHAVTFLQATGEQYDAIYSVFGAIGLVAPELLLPAIAEHLRAGRILAFSVPHPARGGRRPSSDDRPRWDFVTLPDGSRLPIARWEFDANRWDAHLACAGLRATSAMELRGSRHDRWPTTLLITARKT
ncbi:bifunctional 2-polyprenyl-6-hydroxyphenol methylase/3-demethylubiquinol 3-O-methyltransferase UbiG [Streptomyces sp. NBC_00620]|uniref:class I SAM-dependent methyltransferase n=1 Tax=Streptomyces sp. NBC_00620 TaxID=2903666 RepID=UPI00224D888F|nr:class I SAM-dependent methyltransferase [Streptomyces sp. NBC_00620]MCX4972576.1 class I SAM-dependent methyltransferase [Streptomyces sp. NBC_00620]